MQKFELLLPAFFRLIVSYPRTALSAGLIVIVALASGLMNLHKDTSVDAFIPVDHPSLLASQRTAEVFGLSDPIAVAVMTTSGESIFTPQALTLIAELTTEIAALPNVRADRVASLATESSIQGSDAALLVDPYILLPVDDDAAADARERWLKMPPHRASLVAEDESGAVIMAELIDAHAAAATYEAVQSLVAEHAGSDFELLVAGPGAVSGFLSSYIDRDARVLQPVVFLLIMIFLYAAFRRPGALLGPLLVVAGAAGGALGIMAWQGVPYFAITNALPVILVSISVADAIHILSAYYQLRARQPTRQTREIIVLAMTDMARPITLTTLTTIAGFFGIGMASIMPPIQYFAWYAGCGVGLAWVFSIVVLPAVIRLLKLSPSPAFASWREHNPGRLGYLFARIGQLSITRPGTVLASFALLVVIAGIGASQLRIDRSQVENFAPDEPIRLADERINSAFAGTAFLDVMVDAADQDGLLDPGVMQKVADLQSFMDNLPHVAKTVSIVDYLSLLHHALGAVPAGEKRLLPDAEGAIAQYLLVYETSGDPTDFAEEIDPEYRTALIRGVLDTPYFRESQVTVERLSRYLEAEFNEPGLTGTLAGDVNLSYHWMSRLERSHFIGVGLSLILVFAMAVFAFRSIGAGFAAVVPVTFTILVLYGVMGYLDIYLEPATSMFAAISVGVGVDFAIHLVDRLRLALRLKNGDLPAAVRLAMPGTARACFFNAAALGVGFSALLLSDLPTLQRFGGLVSIAAFASFLCALFIVPALYAAVDQLQRRAVTGRRLAPRSVPLVLLAASVLLLNPPDAQAANYTGLDIAQRVADRPEGLAASRVIHMQLVDRRGRIREREARVLKYHDESGKLTRITYLAPKSVRGVAFLSHDYVDAFRDDDRWLYLPAARKVRRIPASDRGDYFLGTDFTFEDVQSDLKFDVDDYVFHYDRMEERDGVILHHISGEPRDQRTAQELGYGAFRAAVSAQTWMPVQIEFYDPSAEHLKSVFVRRVIQVDGIWTAHEVEAVNHQTGHRTLFEYRDVAYPETLPAEYFEPATLSRGPQRYAP